VELIIHEIVHHWLGNAVGLDLWIKEGLCQYFEQVISTNKSLLISTKANLKNNTNKLQNKKGGLRKLMLNSKEVLQNVDNAATVAAIDGDLTYNGIDYQKSKMRMQNFIYEHCNKGDEKKLQDILKKIVKENLWTYLHEEDFLSYFS